MTNTQPAHPRPDSTRDEFLWGVATSAYQSEGGYNGEGQPQTNWAGAEAKNEVAAVGVAAEFWTRYAEDFANCRKMGLTAFRLGIEWSRVQPSLANAPSQPPGFDTAALDHYAEILISCRSHGLEPVVTLHHFVHPAWLGDDPWLEPSSVLHFTRFVQFAVRHVNAVLARRGYPVVRYYITINEPNMLLFNTYLGCQFPSRASRGFDTAIKACCQLLCAHINAYNSIHDIYAAQAWEPPMVSLNNYCSDLYWADKFLIDLLALRERNINLAEATAHIRQNNNAFESALRVADIPLRKTLSYWLGTLCKKLINRFCHLHFDIDGFRPLTESLSQSPRRKVLDYLALDYYDPFSAHFFRPPMWRDHEFKNKSIHSWLMNTVASKWWDWRVLPRGLHFFCRHYSLDFPGKPLLVAENGMALRRSKDNQASHRRDRITRSQFLQLHFREVINILQEGIPLIGYLHWSLFDNYEWGTYTPRFGLYSLDYQQGTDRIPVDHHGDCPSLTYANLIKRFKAGQRLRQPDK
jgi:beta-glucosidase